MRLRTILLLLLTLLPFHHAPAETSAEARASAYAVHNTSAYTLPPDKLQKAKALAHLSLVLTFVNTLWPILQLAGLLAFGHRYPDARPHP